MDPGSLLYFVILSGKIDGFVLFWKSINKVWYLRGFRYFWNNRRITGVVHLGGTDEIKM